MPEEENVTSINKRDRLRSMTVGAKKDFRTKLVEVDGEEFEIRQPSIKERSAIIQRAQVGLDDDNKPKVDPGIMQVESILRLCYVPGTNELVYESGDRENLMGQPTGGFVDELGQACMKMLNIKKETEKDFGKAQRDSSSSE